VGPNQIICGQASTLSGNLPTSGTGLWTLVSGSGTISSNQNATSTVNGLGFGSNIFKWTITDAPCAPSNADLTITNNLPARPNAGVDKTVCTDVETLSATNLPTGLSGNWSLVSGSGQVTNINASTSTISNLGIGLNVFAYSIVVPQCSTTVSDSITLIREINPIDLGKDTIVCQNITPTYSLIGPPNMNNYSWSSGQSAPQITVSQNNTYILNVLTIGGCSFSDTVIVSFTICTSVGSEMTSISNAFIIPNPSIDKAELLLNNYSDKVDIEIFDSKGSKIETPFLVSQDTNQKVVLPNGFSSGVYFIKVSDPRGIKMLKWIVK
jgi:hypothetical protein